jgi:type III secretion system low calcium response chaperone LcrH/SycD
MARDIEKVKIDPDVIDEITRSVVFEGYTFKDFAKISDDEMEAAYAVAFNLVNQGQFEDAEKLLAWLAGLDQFEPKYLIGVGICRQQMGQHQGAVDAFSAAGVLEVANPVPALRAAECYLAMGQMDQARSGLKAALHWAGEKPAHAAIRQRAAALLASLDRRTEA